MALASWQTAVFALWLTSGWRSSPGLVGVDPGRARRRFGWSAKLPSAGSRRRRAGMRSAAVCCTAGDRCGEANWPLAEASKLGCVLFQFPPWFRKNRASVDYLRELRERLPWPIAIEFRGSGWMEAERQSRTLKLLEDLGLAYVSVDEPQGFPSSTPPVVACTSGLALLRLHGHNAETWEKPNITAAERFRYLYTEDELRGWV